MTDGSNSNLTILFADIVSSSSILNKYSRELADEFLSELCQIMAEAVEDSKGVVNQVLGDGVMAVFGLNEENHALQACCAAKLILDRVLKYNKDKNTKFKIRVGISSGNVVIHKSKNFYRSVLRITGDAVHIAARAEQLANENGICMSENTYSLAKEYLSVEETNKEKRAKGFEKEVFFHLKQVQIRSKVVSDEIYIKRDIDENFLNILKENENLAIIAEAGLGKTRLVNKFTSSQKNNYSKIFMWSFIPYNLPKAHNFSSFLIEKMSKVQSVDGYYDEKKPFLIVLEDFHWATLENKKFLKNNMKFLNELNIKVVITSREDIALLDGLKKIKLAVFSRSEFGLAAREYFKESITSIPKEFLNSIYNFSLGVPLTFTEIFQDVSKVISDSKNIKKTDFTNLLKLPAQLSSLYHSRYNQLSKKEKVLINKIACFGYRIELPVLFDFIDYKQYEILVCLNKFEYLGLCKKIHDGNRTFVEFSHAMVHKAIYGYILKKDLLNFHFSIAQFLKYSDHSFFVKSYYIAQNFLLSEQYSKAFYYFKKAHEEYKEVSEYSLSLNCLEYCFDILKRDIWNNIDRKQRRLDARIEEARVYLASEEFKKFEQKFKFLNKQNIVSNKIQLKYHHLDVAYSWCRADFVSAYSKIEKLVESFPFDISTEFKKRKIGFIGQQAELALQIGDLNTAIEKAKQTVQGYASIAKHMGKCGLLTIPDIAAMAVMSQAYFKKGDLLNAQKCAFNVKTLNRQRTDLFTEIFSFCYTYNVLLTDEKIESILFSARRYLEVANKKKVTLLYNWLNAILVFLEGLSTGADKTSTLQDIYFKNKSDGLLWLDSHILKILIKSLIHNEKYELAAFYINGYLNEQGQKENYNYYLFKILLACMNFKGKTAYLDKFDINSIPFSTLRHLIEEFTLNTNPKKNLIDFVKNI